MSVFAGTWTTNSGGILTISDNPDGTLSAQINNVVIGEFTVPPIIGTMTIDQGMTLTGSFGTFSNSGVNFFLATFTGQGTAADSLDGNEFPAALTLTGVIQGDNGGLFSTQYASAFEFPGNAEGVSGALFPWQLENSP